MLSSSSSSSSMIARVYILAALAIAGCEVHVGDGSGWEYDAGGWPDANWDDDDAGSSPKDASGAASDAQTADAAGDTSTPPIKDPVPLVTETLAQGFCAALVQCMGPELAPEFLAGQNCTEFVAKQLGDRENHWLAESVQRGRVELHNDLLADCTNALKAQGCAVVASRLPSACEDAVAGSVALGGECSISADCQGATYCSKGDACPGHCTKRVTRGGTCEASTDCENGLLCRAAKCTAAPIEGDPCSTHMSWCAPGLVCQGESNKSVCASLEAVFVGKENDACDAYGALCVPELVCVSAAGGRDGHCERRAASGGVCGAALPAQCPVSEYCQDPSTGERVAADVSGVCAAKPGSGKVCGDMGCQPGSVCGNGMCVTYGSAGDDCVSDATCYGGRCADGKCAVAATNCELN